MNTSTQPGSMMLMVVLLMSLVLVLCTRMWRTTAYVLDIAIQKQVHVQKKWATKGILKCGVAACQTDFKALHAFVAARNGNYSLPITYSHSIPQLNRYSSLLSFKNIDDTTIGITGTLVDGKKVIHSMSCNVCSAHLVA